MSSQTIAFRLDLRIHGLRSTIRAMGQKVKKIVSSTLFHYFEVKKKMGYYTDHEVRRIFLTTIFLECELYILFHLVQESPLGHFNNTLDP
jgi:hypothetical protein